MRKLLKLIVYIPLLSPCFTIAMDLVATKSEAIPSTIVYSIYGNTFEFTREKVNGDHVDTLYWISDDYNEKKIILEKKGDNNYYDTTLGFDPEGNGLSPDRKFMMVYTLDYINGPHNLPNFNQIFRCNFISTETGKVIYTGIATECDFEWHPLYSGVIRINQHDAKSNEWNYTRLLSLRHSVNYDKSATYTPYQEEKIDYTDVMGIIEQVESLYKMHDYQQIRNIAAKTVVNLAAISPENIEKYSKLGYYYSQAGATGEAIQILSSINIDDTYQAIATLNLADTYWHIKNYDYAKYYYHQYVSMMKNINQLDRIPERVFTIFDVYSVEQILNIKLQPIK